MPRKSSKLQSDNNENEPEIDPLLIQKARERVNLKPSSELASYSSAIMSLSLPELAAAELTRFISGCTGIEGAAESLVELAKCRIDGAAKDFDGSAHRILMSQVLSLNAIYEQHAKMASVVADLEQRERLFAIAFKAQEQMRRTLDSLSDIKNPKKPSQFIKNYVKEQINQLKIEPSAQTVEPNLKQLEGLDDEAIDSRLEALGEKYRTPHTNGQGD
ncbi:MAG: hypothetical protein Kow00121_60540 [Elainellaceae cyanobacterium]